jgi:hypothetical protein
MDIPRCVSNSFPSLIEGWLNTEEEGRLRIAHVTHEVSTNITFKATLPTTTFPIVLSRGLVFCTVLKLLTHKIINTKQ